MSHIVMGRGFDQLRGSKNGEVAFSELVGAIHGIFEDTVAMGSSPHEEEMRNNTPNWVGFTENCDKALNIRELENCWILYCKVKLVPF